MKILSKAAEKLVDKELGQLSQKIEDIELENRAEIDQLKLELRALHLTLEKHYPDFAQHFHEMREKIIHEMNPESSSSCDIC